MDIIAKSTVSAPALLEAARKEFPSLRLCPRQKSFFIKALFYVPTVFGADFTRVATTVGHTIYTPHGWEKLSRAEQYCLLRHELVHVRQWHCWPLGRSFALLNFVLFPLAYLFLLPCLWTYRAKFEREAFEETLRAKIETGLLPNAWADIQKEARAVAKTFSGKEYFFMWQRTEAFIWATRFIYATFGSYQR